MELLRKEVPSEIDIMRKIIIKISLIFLTIVNRTNRTYYDWLLIIYLHCSEVSMSFGYSGVIVFWKFSITRQSDCIESISKVRQGSVMVLAMVE